MLACTVSFFFFFSSRRRHTRCSRDWSSDVCSSDLVNGLSWAPDPEHSRLVAFDGQLRLARRLTSPRLGTPMAVAALPGGRLLVTERTGEGVVLDTAGQPVREWDSPAVASLYAASTGRIVAARSPYYVPELGSPEPDTAPLLRVLDTLGHPVEGLATIRVPAVPLLTHLVNAGAVAVGPDGSVYYAPLVRDEIRKYAPSGAPRWTARRGLISKESEPVFLPARGKRSEEHTSELQSRLHLVCRLLLEKKKTNKGSAN